MTFEDVMLAQLTAFSAVPKSLNAAHLLVLLPKDKALPRDVPHRELLAAVLKRRGIKIEEFAAPVAANHAEGSLIAWAMLDFGKIPETLPGARRADAACGLVFQPLRRRTGQRGQRRDRVWRGLGAEDVAGQMSRISDLPADHWPEVHHQAIIINTERT
jgi:hypothetical protein